MKVVLYPKGAAMEMPYGASEKYYTDAGLVVAEMDQVPTTEKEIIAAWNKHAPKPAAAPQAEHDHDDDDDEEGRA